MFRNKSKIQLSVSELSTYFSCARRLYYSCRESDPFSSYSLSYIEHIILKEMAMLYPHMLKPTSAKDDISIKDLELLLSNALETISLIYPDEMKDVAAEDLNGISMNLRAHFSEMQDNLTGQSQNTDVLLLAEKLSMIDEDPVLHSEKLNITGIPYRTVENEGSFEPVIIKTTRPPENGVWMNDRLKITSYAMLSEEMYGNPVKSGHILYARSGLFRNVTIRSIDRRQVLQAIGRARKIKDGTMPDKNEGPLCKTCSYSEKCNVTGSLVSKFF